MQYLDGLYSYALTLTRNEPEAEHLVQTTYRYALTDRQDTGSDISLKAQLFQITRSIWRLRNPHGMDAEEEFTALLGFEERPVDIKNVVESLPLSYRELIILREFERLSYWEIAIVLECTVAP